MEILEINGDDFIGFFLLYFAIFVCHSFLTLVTINSTLTRYGPWSQRKSSLRSRRAWAVVYTFLAALTHYICLLAYLYHSRVNVPDILVLVGMLRVAAHINLFVRMFRRKSFEDLELGAT